MTPGVCPICEGAECPYCGGPEADYHTMCLDCECVQKSRAEQMCDDFEWGARMGVLGGVLGFFLD